MIHEITKDSIKQKLSGKFDHLYPIYLAILDILDDTSHNITIILKTIYIVVDFNNGKFGVLFWAEDGLDFLLPVDISHPRLEDATKYKYGKLSKMICLKNIDDVDDYVKNILFSIIDTK